MIEFGDCRDIMRNWIELGVKVHTCVTSPPYFWLRDYKCDGQIGLEKTPAPFMGSGTTAAVAKRLGCYYMGCELNPENAPLIAERLA